MSGQLTHVDTEWKIEPLRPEVGTGGVRQPQQCCEGILMRSFMAASSAAAMSELSRAASGVRAANAWGLPEDDVADRRVIKTALGQIKPSLLELAPSLMLASQLERLEHRVEKAAGPELAVLARELHESVITELTQAHFLMIPSPERAYYEQHCPLFGSVVADRFPEAGEDIAAAGRCLALDEGTAAVFHLMRVLEHGLRLVALRFNAPFQVDSWHAVIRAIENGINDLRNQRGLTEQDRAEITFYSEVANEFRYFKDAWRNHVSHARAVYQKREAAEVFAHVKAFMDRLASNS